MEHGSAIFDRQLVDPGRLLHNRWRSLLSFAVARPSTIAPYAGQCPTVPAFGRDLNGRVALAPDERCFRRLHCPDAAFSPNGEMPAVNVGGQKDVIPGGPEEPRTPQDILSVP